jgi:hypothetical protein
LHPVVRTIAASLAMALAITSPASAKTMSSTYLTEDGIGAEASKEAEAPSKRSGGSTTPQPVCTYSNIADSPDAVRADEQGNPAPLYDSTHPSTAGSWMWKQCTDETGAMSMRTVWAPTVNASTIAQQAIANQTLPMPAVSVNPPLPGGAVVNYPTWLWVDGASWRTITATASVDGLSVTATATPQSVVWTMGDGGSVTCNGPGTPYDAAKPATEQRSDCTHSFTRSSASQPGQAFTATASMQWVTTWQASDGTSGSLGTVTRSSTFSLPVREIQAVNVSPTGGK